MYLVDTNVISPAAPTKPGAMPKLADWMNRHSDELYLSVVTIAEIESGIAKSRRMDAGRKAERLTHWLETVLHLYSRRVLHIDICVTRRLGAMSDQARAAGHAPGFADLAIAATAATHGYTLLTRNTRQFLALDVAVCDPFEHLPRSG